ncbi:MAG: DUF692 family protein [Anaerolineae bacterium]|nr:DUF692 family protein [Anaerolineae bacterium]
MNLSSTLSPTWPRFEGRPLLGANGTEAMRSLLSRGLDHLVDYLKVGPFMGREAIAALAARYPLMLHLDDTLSGWAPLSQEAMRAILDLVALSGTPWASEHIGFNVAGVRLGAALSPWPAAQTLLWTQARDNIVRNAEMLAKALPVPLILENVPLFPNWAHLHIAEPEFIWEVTERVGCGLLLDLAHARVTATVLGCDPRAYLQRLPLDRVVELHLSGPRPVKELSERRRSWIRENADTVADRLHVDGETLVDVHETLREEDYALLDWTLARAKPEAVTLEYYFDADLLQTQLLRLATMLGRG